MRAVLVAALLPIFLSLACAWVRTRERRALARGVPLTAAELDDARALGIHKPARVRLLRVDRIPAFEQPLLRALTSFADRFFAQTRGITLGHAILVRTDCWRERHLIAHELAHVAQYERLGGIRPFLRAYLRECLLDGYPHGPLEREAIAAAARICA